MEECGGDSILISEPAATAAAASLLFGGRCDLGTEPSPLLRPAISRAVNPDLLSCCCEREGELDIDPISTLLPLRDGATAVCVVPTTATDDDVEIGGAKGGRRRRRCLRSPEASEELPDSDVDVGLALEDVL